MLVEYTSGNMLTLAQVDYDDLVAFHNPTGGWNYSYDNSGWPALYWGFRIDSLTNRNSLISAYKKVIKATYPNPATTRYQGRYRGRIYRFFNNICPIVLDYDEKTDWVESLSSLDNASNEFIGFFIKNGVAEDTLYSGLSSIEVIDDGNYGCSQYVNHWVEAHFHGNLFPAKLFPGKAYENYNDEQTDNIKALQAMLLLYNATLYSDSLGRIIFKNKDAYSSTITEIAYTDTQALELDLSEQNICAFGAWGSNLWLNKHLPKAPFQILADKIIADKEYPGTNLRLAVCLPNPLNSELGLAIYTAQSITAMKGGIRHGPQDWYVYETDPEPKILGQGDFRCKRGEWIFDGRD